MADEEYGKKVQRLRRYIPFVSNVIAQLKDHKKTNRERQLAKMVSLHSMIVDVKQKFKLETLTKCEDVLRRLYKSRSGSPSPLPLSRPPHPSSTQPPNAPSSLDPPREDLKSKPAVMPTEQPPDRYERDVKMCQPVTSYNPKIDISSSAADYLTKTNLSSPKDSVFDRLDPKLSKPPISKTDLRALQQNVLTYSNELTDPRDKLQKQWTTWDHVGPNRILLTNTTVSNTTILTKKTVENAALENSKPIEIEPVKTSSPVAVKPLTVVRESSSIFGSGESSIDKEFIESKGKEKEKKNSVGSKKESSEGRRSSRDKKSDSRRRFEERHKNKSELISFEHKTKKYDERKDKSTERKDDGKRHDKRLQHDKDRKKDGSLKDKKDKAKGDLRRKVDKDRSKNENKDEAKDVRPTRPSQSTRDEKPRELPKFVERLTVRYNPKPRLLQPLLPRPVPSWSPVRYPSSTLDDEVAGFNQKPVLPHAPQRIPPPLSTIPIPPLFYVSPTPQTIPAHGEFGPNQHRPHHQGHGQSRHSRSQNFQPRSLIPLDPNHNQYDQTQPNDHDYPRGSAPNHKRKIQRLLSTRYENNYEARPPQRPSKENRRDDLRRLPRTTNQRPLSTSNQRVPPQARESLVHRDPRFRDDSRNFTSMSRRDPRVYERENCNEFGDSVLNRLRHEGGRDNPSEHERESTRPLCRRIEGNIQCASRFDSLYSGKYELNGNTGRGYEMQNFKIPKIRKNEYAVEENKKMDVEEKEEVEEKLAVETKEDDEGEASKVVMEPQPELKTSTSAKVTTEIKETVSSTSNSSLENQSEIDKESAQIGEISSTNQIAERQPRDESKPLDDEGQMDIINTFSKKVPENKRTTAALSSFIDNGSNSLDDEKKPASKRKQLVKKQLSEKFGAKKRRAMRRLMLQRRRKRSVKSYVEVDSNREEQEELEREKEREREQGNEREKEEEKRRAKNNEDAKKAREQEERDKEKQEEKVTAPNKVKKRANAWATGVLPKTKKMKPTQEKEDPDPDRSFETLEPDRNYYSSRVWYTNIVCKLSDYDGTNITKHPRSVHPHFEVPFSRLSPAKAEEAISLARDPKISKIHLSVNDDDAVRNGGENFNGMEEEEEPKKKKKKEPKKKVEETITEDIARSIKKGKKIEMGVFTCNTSIQEENRKMQQERLQKMTKLAETVNTKRHSLNFVDELSNRLLQEEKHIEASLPESATVKIELANDDSIPELEPEISFTDDILEIWSKKPTKMMEPVAASAEVVEKDTSNIQSIIQRLQGNLRRDKNGRPPPLTPLIVKKAKAFISTGCLNICKTANGLEYGCRVLSCLFTSTNRDSFVLHWKEDHNKVNQGYESIKCRICNEEVKATPTATLLLTFFAHVEKKHLSGIRTSFNAGLIGIDKVREGNEYVCLVKMCNFIAKNRETFVLHLNDHKTSLETCKSTGCEICQGLISRTADSDLLNNLFAHIEGEHVEQEKPSEVNTVRTRRLSADRLPTAEEESPELKETEDNPFPFRIAGVVSLTENSVSALFPITEIPPPKVDNFILKEVEMTNVEKALTWKCSEAVKEFLQCPEDLYKCPQFLCKFSTRYRYILEEHIKAHTGLNDNLVCCVYCDIKTPLSQAGFHIDLRHANCLYSCSQCLYRASTREYLIIHYRMKHKENGLVPPPKNAKIVMMSEEKRYTVKDACQPYRCGYQDCNAPFLFLSEFCTHLQTCHDGVMMCGHLNNQQRCGFNCLVVENMIDHWKSHACYHYHCLLCKVGTMEMYTMVEHYALTHPNTGPMVVDRRNAPMSTHILGYSDEAVGDIRFIKDELLRSVTVQHVTMIGTQRA